MSTADDQRFLRRAIDLARRGRGRVEPNPMVGCVLVRDGRIIGEGYHARYGGPHAEPTALAGCTEPTRGATAYVTLEPCCHADKQTPPCAPRLIEAGIARVVIGCNDPNPAVDSKGVAMLRAAGVEVVGPLLEPQMRQLNAAFFKRTRLGQPYVTLKWAQSHNGKVSGAGGRRTQISGGAATRAVHRLRAKSDSILVGIDTVLSDDPQLTVRGVQTFRPLKRAVLDTRLRMPPQSRLARTVHDDVVVFCGLTACQASSHRAALEQLGLRIVPSPERDGRVRLDDVLDRLGGSHLLVEPGPTLARSFFEANAADRVWRIESPLDIDADDAFAAADVPTHYLKTGEVMLGDDRLTEFLNPNSPAYFAVEPSTDLLEINGPHAEANS